MVLVGPGTYHEAVTVTTPHLTIRGVDRNKVILEGDNKLDNAFYVEGANDVEIDNMTARDYTSNGFEWDKVTGFRGLFLTAYDNHSYGVYAFRSTTGEFGYSYASSNGDSGFYIGACFDCKSLIDYVHSENNGLGYSGTNAGGIVIEDSEWNNNVAGIVPNTLPSEDDAPQGGKVGNIITQNYVHDNQNASAPSTFSIGPVGAPLGMGIEIAGGWNNQVIHNTVRNQSHYGITLHWLTEPTIGNQIQFNDIQGSGDADIGWDGAGAQNCFEENVDAKNTAIDPTSGTVSHPATYDPPTLETTNSCGTAAAPIGGDPAVGIRVAIDAAGLGSDAKNEQAQPKPGPQSTMPDPCAGAPSGCGVAGAKLTKQEPVNVQPAVAEVAQPDAYPQVQSLAEVSQGLQQKPTVADVQKALQYALANLRPQTVEVPVQQSSADIAGYLAAAMSGAALLFLVGAGLGFWRRRTRLPG